jgi:microcompartment protein CcmL/EutN
MKNAIGLLEMKNITRGIIAADTMLKAADVELVTAQPLCPGKYIVMVAGDIGAVNSAVSGGRAAGGTENIVDECILPNIHPSIFAALTGCTDIKTIRSLGIIETYSAAAAVVAADLAVKTAAIELLEVRLARGMGGKALVLLTGEIGAVTAAIQAGGSAISDSGFLVDQYVIAAPHQGIHASLY